MSLFFPLFCALFFRRSLESKKNVETLSLDILIPAHNESDSITPTLEAIRNALACAKAKGNIFVAADGCDDDTAAKAGGAGAIVDTVNFKSKWKVIQYLVKKSNADWVALVDCGAIWPSNLLLEMNSFWGNSSVLAIAPSYSPSASNFLSRLFWLFEKQMKRLENFSVGPVSVHGATIFYRRTALENALTLLHHQTWLNDDVVIPMAIQSTGKGQIVYLESTISDIGHLKQANQFVRRRRMTLGNLQWIKLLLPTLRKKNFTAFLLAQRRLFRVFWIYWIGFLFIGVSSYGIIPLLLFILLFRESAVASLLAPYLLLRLKSDRLNQWS